MANVLLAVQALAVPATGVASSISARVVGVIGGDAITVVDAANTQYAVRLAGIDAPQSGQEFGDRSKQHLTNLVLHKEVRVDRHGHDPHGRLVGTVWTVPPDSPCQEPGCPKTLDVGLAQISVGLAWRCKACETGQSEQDRQRYDFAEQEARARKVGIWSSPDPAAPWDRPRSNPPDDADRESRVP
jgi:endonuclease YncB( thermonuclease family)